MALFGTRQPLYWPSDDTTNDPPPPYGGHWRDDFAPLEWGDGSRCYQCLCRERGANRAALATGDQRLDEPSALYEWHGSRYDHDPCGHNEGLERRFSLAPQTPDDLIPDASSCWHEWEESQYDYGHLPLDSQAPFHRDDEEFPGMVWWLRKLIALWRSDAQDPKMPAYSRAPLLSSQGP
ncbi:hypothetical protein LTR53_005726 [Teratosphaeriaceae sp. CCFEE 6253]|nr:hypothetical protein LTR53_005726 [Teratosphaeriaceae sp. CCFEE 6253]